VPQKLLPRDLLVYTTVDSEKECIDIIHGLCASRAEWFALGGVYSFPKKVTIREDLSNFLLLTWEPEIYFVGAVDERVQCSFEHFDEWARKRKECEFKIKTSRKKYWSGLNNLQECVLLANAQFLNLETANIDVRRIRILHTEPDCLKNEKYHLKVGQEFTNMRRVDDLGPPLDNATQL
jgi:hypothetical protein